MSTMKLNDFQRLKRLMALATSDNDHEALQSFRRATEIIRAHGFTWAEVLDRRVTVLSEVEAATEDTSVPGRDHFARTYQQQPRVEDYGLTDGDFELALDGAGGSFRDTLLSIQAQWSNGGRLSPRQVEVVREAAERGAERHPGGRMR